MSTKSEREKSLLERIIELLSCDDELHEALIRYIEAQTDAEKARKEWYQRRRSRFG